MPQFHKVPSRALRIDDNHIIQTDENWEAYLVDHWESPPTNSYSDPDEGGCEMITTLYPQEVELINFPFTNTEKCINSRSCYNSGYPNCCFTKVRKEFYVQEVVGGYEEVGGTCANPDYYCCNGSCTEPEPELDTAVLSLSFSDVDYEYQEPCRIDTNLSRCHIYTHTRNFTEHNNVGINLTKGQVCLDSTGCKPNVTIDYRINAKDTLIQENKKFYTSYSSEVFTLKYWGEDDNNHDIYIEQYMCVNGENSFVNTQIC